MVVAVLGQENVKFNVFDIFFLKFYFCHISRGTKASRKLNE